jgi:hypothetical protein
VRWKEDKCARKRRYKWDGKGGNGERKIK